MTQVDEGPESPGGPGVLTFGVPTVGEVLAERYQLQEHINDDAFGRQVWRGVDVVLRRPVAVVLRYPGGASATEMLDAAVSASRVVHPHLVDVYDAIDEGTRAYVVREWVDGGSLRDHVSEAPLEPDRVTSVTSAVASAVAAVHASGCSHSNVHPGTVLIGSDGRVVLADARADEEATPDTDIRAIGGVLYYALTGYWPHAEAGANDLPDAPRDPSGVLAAPRQVRGGVPSHLSDLATDLLDPQVAPPSADVLAAELSRLESDGEDEFFASGGPLDFEHQSVFPETSVIEPHRPIAKKLAVGVAGLLVLAILGLLLVTQVFSGGNTNANTSPATSTSAGTNHPSNGQPTLLPINGSQVRVVDPGGDRTELTNAGNVVDGNPNTFWRTQHYVSAPNFGNSKPGMGILIDLGEAKSISTVKVQFQNEGATVDLRAGSTDPGNSTSGDKAIYNSYQVIADAREASSTLVFTVGSDKPPTRYLLVWISKLPVSTDDPSRWQVGISEIQVYAN